MAGRRDGEGRRESGKAGQRAPEKAEGAEKTEIGRDGERERGGIQNQRLRTFGACQTEEESI